MIVRGTITFMEGPRIPQDVIREDVLDGLPERVDMVTELNLGAVKTPPSTTQIIVTIWESGDESNED